MQKDKIGILIKGVYKIIFRRYYFNHLKTWLSDCDSLLDLGCGRNSPVQYCKTPLKVCVEGFDLYINESKEKKIHNKYIKSDIRNVDFASKSFDAVLALDVIEHLPKKDSIEILKKMEKWARKKVILSVPNGFMPEGAIDSNPLQEHRCAWEVEELESMGFKVFGFNGLKRLREKAIVNGKPVYFWSLISDLALVAIHHNPKWAFNLCAVKELN